MGLKLSRHTRQAISSMKSKVKYDKFQSPRIRQFVQDYKIAYNN